MTLARVCVALDDLEQALFDATDDAIPAQ